jgi:hypothetical protein
MTTITGLTLSRKASLPTLPEELNFTRAAKRCGVAQPSLTNATNLERVPIQSNRNAL